MAKLTVTIDAPRAAPEHKHFGADNAWGHAQFSDGKSYRFRYSLIRPGGGWASGRQEGEYFVTLWRASPKRMHREIIQRSAAREAMVAEAVKPLIPMLRDAALAKASEEQASQDREDAERTTSQRKRNAAEEMFEALQRATALFEVALPQFDWGKSALSGEAIRLLNDVPVEVAQALKLAREGRPDTA